jgi:glycerol-3-phosphate acyltransferase PlsY
MIKAAAAVGLGGWFFSNLGSGGGLLGEYWAALFCLVGHMFPCMFRFKGGQGILSGGTAAIMIDWRLAIVVWGAFLIAVVLSRYVSLGSCCAAAAFPAATWWFFRDWQLTALALFIGALIVFMHRANIVRLCRGTESKFHFHRQAKKEGGNQS